MLWLELVMVDQQLRQKRRETPTILDYKDGCPDERILLDLSTEVDRPRRRAAVTGFPASVGSPERRVLDRPRDRWPRLSKTARCRDDRRDSGAAPQADRRHSWPLASRSSIRSRRRPAPMTTTPLVRSTCPAPSAQDGKAEPPRAAPP